MVGNYKRPKEICVSKTNTVQKFIFALLQIVTPPLLLSFQNSDIQSLLSVKNQWNLSRLFFLIWRMLELETNFYWWNFNLFFHFVKIFYFLKICQKLQKAKGNLCVQNQDCAKVHFFSTSHPPEIWGEYSISSKIQCIYNNVRI